MPVYDCGAPDCLPCINEFRRPRGTGGEMTDKTAVKKAAASYEKAATLAPKPATEVARDGPAFVQMLTQSLGRWA